jgi:hypothetical protein
MKWQPGRYHLNDVAPLILWFVDRGAFSPGLGHGMLVSNHKEMHGGDGMEVMREVDGRWKKDRRSRRVVERPSIAA